MTKWCLLLFEFAWKRYSNNIKQYCIKYSISPKEWQVLDITLVSSIGYRLVSYRETSYRENIYQQMRQVQTDVTS